ncbi:MAG: hypothetical protein AVDCRST_MAG79-1736, partial [uncultured Thermoleophilia bacterium]
GEAADRSGRRGHEDLSRDPRGRTPLRATDHAHRHLLHGGPARAARRDHRHRRRRPRRRPRRPRDPVRHRVRHGTRPVLGQPSRGGRRAARRP